MDRIDVLYILGKGSLYGNEELRYSLRSLDKFGQNVGRLFITGECPEFINREKITFLPEIDIGCPAINHWWKVDQTFRKTDIGEKALLMYDDIFFCKQTDCANYPWRWRDELPTLRPDGEYRRSLYNSGLFLEKKNLPVMNYTLHQPCIYEKDKFLSLEKYFVDWKMDGIGMSPRCVYANMFVQEKTNQMDDLKIRSKVDDLDALIKDRDCFSIADDCFSGPVKEWLEKNLPERSQWEK